MVSEMLLKGCLMLGAGSRRFVSAFVNLPHNKNDKLSKPLVCYKLVRCTVTFFGLLAKQYLTKECQLEVLPEICFKFVRF